MTANLLQKNPTKCGAENLAANADVNNRLHPNSGPDFGYDAAGNMTKDNLGQTYTYDAENRISVANGLSGSDSYVYDADGNRVEKNNGGTGTIYWYMAPGIVAESDLSGNLKSEYVFFNGRRTARKDFPGGTVSYYFSDELKTADVITDAVGNIRSESDYYPWGGELSFISNDSNHYKFTGKERDAETGLDYFGARYYGNALGRWLTPDWAAKATAVPYAEFSDPQSLNLYTYVRDIPTTRIDADGHTPGDDDKQSSVPGLKPVPSVGETIEVKAGVCFCFGGTLNAGPVQVQGSAQAVGIEVKTNLAGDPDVKVSSKVSAGVRVGSASVKVEGGTEASMKEGQPRATGKATINGVGAKVDKNGVSPVLEKTATADSKLGGEVSVGAVKVGASVNVSKLRLIWEAVKWNLPIIGGGVVQHYMPGAGTENVGQRPTGSDDQHYGPNGRQIFQ